MSSALRTNLRRFAIVVFACTCILGPTAQKTWAAGPAESAMDAPALVELEQRAASAEIRERCYLYSELLHDWTELAGRAMSEGNDSAAATAIEHADLDAAKLKAAIERDSKRLKNAELLLEHTAHRLSDMVRVATMDQHDTMQAVLKHLNSVHDELLAQIFAH